MGIFDKLKNALFEEEYYEVEEKPKKKHNDKVKTSNKPIAKKVVLPEKSEKVEEIEEEELKNDNFEFRPKDDVDKEELMSKRSSFKILEDEDLTVDDPIEDDIKKIIIEPVESKKEEDGDIFDFTDDKEIKEVESSFDDYKEATEEVSSGYSFEKPTYTNSLYSEKKPYGIDKSKEIHVSDYGSYDRYEDKTVFRPTPVISPIYGILDKNYKKDDIVQKKGVRLSSSFSRGNVSIDDIRQKAYGKTNDVVDEFEEDINDNSNSFEINNKEEDNLLVDLTNSDRPSVKEVTMGDAEEYFEDLGLEYNVDYVDKNKSNDSLKGTKEEKVQKRVTPEIDLMSDEKVVPEREEKKETKKEIDTDNDSDDNLFDLIDSMYQE